MNTRKIITFYSYKGGVGRTFALANVAVLLARWGYRVLCMDWDLEAPGLTDYFRPAMNSEVNSGLIDWIEGHGNDAADWQQHVIQLEVPWKAGEGLKTETDERVMLDFIAVGRQDDDYIRRIQALDWAKLYNERKLGSRLEELREDFLLAYDFVLIDSRTGISDSGGICTIQLPDVLVFLFTANGQSLRGVTDAVRRAKSAQRNLPHDRAPLLTLPVLSRFDGKEEHKRGQEWLTRIAQALPEFYTQWVDAPPVSEKETIEEPHRLVDSPRLLSLCTLPYVPFWSFGEELAVTSENTSFSQNISFHLETVAAILAHRLTKSSLLLESRQKFVDTARLETGEEVGFEYQVFITSDFRLAREAGHAARFLQAKGIPVWHDSLHERRGDSFMTSLQDALKRSKHFVVLCGPSAGTDRTLDQLTRQILKELADRPGDRRFVPLVKKGPPIVLPQVLRDRITLVAKTLEPEVLGVRIETGLSLDAKMPPPLRLLDRPGDPEDKDFARLRLVCGAELAGVLGSPNFRHGETIHAAAYASDGKTAWSGGGDGWLRQWDLETGREILSIKGHRGSVLACALSANGQFLLSCSDDKTLKLWDPRSGLEVQSFQGHPVSVYACALNNDGKCMVSGSGDTTLKLWDISSGEEIRSFQGHQGAVNACAISPDGRYLLSGSDDKTLKLWHVASGDEIRSFKGHQGSVLACAISGDGQRLLSGSQDKTLKLWDAASGKEIRSFKGHQDYVRCCALSMDGQRLLSGSDDKTLKFWDASTGKEIRHFEVYQGWVYACAISADAQRLLSGSDDKTLKLWDANNGHEILSFHGHQGYVFACALSADGAHLLSGSADNTLKLWDVSSGQEIRSFQGHQGAVYTCAISIDGQRLLSGSADNTLKLWDASSGQVIRSFQGHEGSVLACAISADGQRLLSGSGDNTLILWDAKSGKVIRCFQGHQGWVRTCAISADGQRLLSGSADNTLKLWNASSGQEIRSFQGHQGAVYACAISADGQRLVSGSADTTLKLWNASSGRVIRSFQGHQGAVYGCAISADGQHLLSCSDDNTLKFWDASSGKEIRSWNLPHPGMTVALTTTPPELWPERRHTGPILAAVVGLNNGTLMLFDLTDV
jgi:WD40 repeat protein/MinD-like ATPase involved in chromosome partitioning or flagellar assembly